MLENAMVLCDAPEYAPVVIRRLSVCPRCDALWEDVGEDVTEHPGCDWQHTNTITLHSTPWHEHPTSQKGCPCCALDNAPADRLAAYIEAHGLQKAALEYCVIVAWDWPNALDADYVSEIWQALRGRLMQEDRLRDYIRDEKSSEFVRWYLEE